MTRKQLANRLFREVTSLFRAFDPTAAANVADYLAAILMELTAAKPNEPTRRPHTHTDR